MIIKIRLFGTHERENIEIGKTQKFHRNAYEK
jgi:hypothetical protein